MRTARLLTVSQHALRRVGVCPGRVSAQGVSVWGVSAWGVPRGVMADPRCGQNDRQVYKHYLATTSLRAVKMLASLGQFKEL